MRTANAAPNSTPTGPGARRVDQPANTPVSVGIRTSDAPTPRAHTGAGAAGIGNPRKPLMTNTGR